MKLIELKWIGVKKHIPNYGTFNKNDISTFPDEIAIDLIEQGLATRVKKTKYEDKGKPPNTTKKED